MPSRVRRHAALVACGMACAWALLVMGAPLLASSPPAMGKGPLALSALAYLAGSVLCHQRPERSFHLAGAQLPVCGRCTALYLAGALGLLFGTVVPGGREPMRVLAGRFTWRALLIAASLPIALSVGLEWAGVWAGSNAVRAVSALPLGWAVGGMTAESLSFRGKL